MLCLALAAPARHGDTGPPLAVQEQAVALRAGIAAVVNLHPLPVALDPVARRNGVLLDPTQSELERLGEIHELEMKRSGGARELDSRPCGNGQRAAATT